MFYACNQKKYPNSVDFPFYPCDAVDANGKLVNLPLEALDTVSGMGWEQLRDPDGSVQIDMDNGTTVTRIVYLAAPLTIVPYVPPTPDSNVSDPLIVVQYDGTNVVHGN